MVKMDQMVTGLAALQMTPQSTMQHSVKIVDDSFYWSDKALNVSNLSFYKIAKPSLN